MRSVSLLCVFVAFAVPQARALEPWRFHCEAEKGGLVASIPRRPTLLDAYLFRLPGYSPDPLGRDAVLLDSVVRVVGTFGTHRVIEAQLRLKAGSYTDFYLLLCEVAPARYLPIYAQQYARGVRTPELTTFSATNDRCRLTVRMLYSGTEASRTTDEVILTEEPKTGIRLRWRRDP